MCAKIVVNTQQKILVLAWNLVDVWPRVRYNIHIASKTGVEKCAKVKC
jgi:hypothetical protein